MAEWDPVDHDPFDGTGPTFVPVDHDPFADSSSAGTLPQSLPRARASLFGRKVDGKRAA
jgi:hypothetical protein